MNKPTPYRGTEPYIFISYAHKDSHRVWPIIDRLISDGYRVWYDEGIIPVREWDDDIAKHVVGCAMMAAFMSANYLASDNCKDELNFARDKNKPRLLVYLEDVTLPDGMAMRLNRGQAVRCFDYTDQEEYFAKLYQAEGFDLCHGTATSPAPTPAPVESEEEILFQQGEIFYRIGDFHKAASYYISAAEAGHVEAQFRMGYLCEVDRNFPRAFYWYLQAALQGHPEAMCKVGNCYATGQGTDKNPAKATDWFRKSGDAGWSDGYFRLGKQCAEETPPAYTEALIWFRKAHAMGHPKAEEWVNYTNDHLNLAAKQGKLRLRATQGNVEAMMELAKSLNNNREEAFSWLTRAAQQGNPEAMYELGMCHYLGNGTSADIQLAIDWLLKAAELGHADAMYQLADLYQDYSEDLELFDDDDAWEECVHHWRLKAAQLGHRSAQYTLGLDYRYGNCAQEDLAQAVYWYRQAAAQGCDASRKQLEELDAL